MFVNDFYNMLSDMKYILLLGIDWSHIFMAKSIGNISFIDVW